MLLPSILAVLALGGGPDWVRSQAGLCAEDTHAEIEGFFATRVKGVIGGPRVLSEVLDSVDQCVARKQAQQPSLAAYLEMLPTGRPPN